MPESGGIPGACRRKFFMGCMVAEVQFKQIITDKMDLSSMITFYPDIEACIQTYIWMHAHVHAYIQTIHTTHTNKPMYTWEHNLKLAYQNIVMDQILLGLKVTILPQILCSVSRGTVVFIYLKIKKK